MANKTNVIQEIYNRINRDMATGQPLAGIKQLRVGHVEEARKENDLPIVNISLEGGTETVNFHNNAFVDEMSISVTLLHTKNKSTTNTLFYTSGADTLGALPLFEKLLNAIDKNASGVPDISLGQTANNVRNFSYTIREDSAIVEIALTISLETKIFIAGAR